MNVSTNHEARDYSAGLFFGTISLRASIAMNDDEIDTFLIDHNPAKLLPFSKRLLPEDPEATELGRHFMRNGIASAADVEL